MADYVNQLLHAHSLVSDQVSKQQVEVILRELTAVLERGPEGAVVEFGCYVGTTSVFISRLLATLDPSREFHVYDSFAGLPPKSAQDASRAGEQFVAGALAVSKKQFIQTFQKSHLPLPVIHKGWFNELSPADVPSSIAFAFLDGDFYSSIHDSLQLVRPRMQQGGVIIVDDYAREALPGAAKAVQEYFSTDTIRVVHNLGVIHL